MIVIDGQNVLKYALEIKFWRGFQCRVQNRSSLPAKKTHTFLKMEMIKIYVIFWKVKLSIGNSYLDNGFDKHFD